jgi:hypothetical protein
MSEFRDKLMEINRRIDAMKRYDPSAVLPDDADSADAIEQILLAQVHLSTAADMMATLRKKYELSEYSDSEDDQLMKARYSLLDNSLDQLDEMDEALELIVDNIADSEDGEPDFVIGLLEEFEETGEFGFR